MLGIVKSFDGEFSTRLLYSEILMLLPLPPSWSWSAGGSTGLVTLVWVSRNDCNTIVCTILGPFRAQKNLSRGIVIAKDNSLLIGECFYVTTGRMAEW